MERPLVGLQCPVGLEDSFRAPRGGEGTTMLTLSRTRRTIERTRTLLARVRHKQLDLALRGRVVESARYAHLANRIRRFDHALARGSF